jgi:predicted lipoprotein
MTATSAVQQRPGISPKAKRFVWIGVAAAVLIAMALSTKVVDINSTQGAPAGSFSPSAWGKKEFPQVQAAIDKRAVDAKTLAAAVAADPTAAGKKYGVQTGAGAEVPVRFTGVVGNGDSGIYAVKVPGLPKDLLIRVQTGPAVNGTDLRDAPGNIKFGQFKNQIDYQNAGAALNNELKKQVLAKVDTAHLKGKTITVVGAFQLINPKGWLITPVKLRVQ